MRFAATILRRRARRRLQPKSIGEPGSTTSQLVERPWHPQQAGSARELEERRPWWPGVQMGRCRRVQLQWGRQDPRFQHHIIWGVHFDHCSVQRELKVCRIPARSARGGLRALLRNSRRHATARVLSSDGTTPHEESLRARKQNKSRTGLELHQNVHDPIIWLGTMLSLDVLGTCAVYTGWLMHAVEGSGGARTRSASR